MQCQFIRGYFITLCEFYWLSEFRVHFPLIELQFTHVPQNMTNSIMKLTHSFNFCLFSLIPNLIQLIQVSTNVS